MELPAAAVIYRIIGRYLLQKQPVSSDKNLPAIPLVIACGLQSIYGRLEVRGGLHEEVAPPIGVLVKNLI